MLPKPRRLTEEKDFKRVMQQGRSFFIKECGIKILNTKHGIQTRIGIVVPKKLTKTIVRRNRIKRQVRHIFLSLLPSIAPGYDIVFLAREGFLALEFGEMKEKIGVILEKGGCINKLKIQNAKFKITVQSLKFLIAILNFAF